MPIKPQQHRGIEDLFAVFQQKSLAKVTISTSCAPIGTCANKAQAAADIKAEDLEACIYSDGVLPIEHMTLPVAELLRDTGPWGQAFPVPLFHGDFLLKQQRLLVGLHLKMGLVDAVSGVFFEVIAFRVDLQKWPNHHCQRLRIAYRLSVNEYAGRRSLQLIVEQMQAIEIEMGTEKARPSPSAQF